MSWNCAALRQRSKQLSQRTWFILQNDFNVMIEESNLQHNAVLFLPLISCVILGIPRGFSVIKILLKSALTLTFSVKDACTWDKIINSSVRSNVTFPLEMLRKPLKIFKEQTRTRL